MAEITFESGSSDTGPLPGRKELKELVSDASPQYWNGSSGASCISLSTGNATVYLLLSVSEDQRWHIRYQLADGSFVIAHDRDRKSDAPIALWLGGNRVLIPAEQFVASASAMSIIEQFVDEGWPDPKADWRVPKPQP